jgi:hypothetical protein
MVSVWFMDEASLVTLGLDRLKILIALKALGFGSSPIAYIDYFQTGKSTKNCPVAGKKHSDFGITPSGIPAP